MLNNVTCIVFTKSMLVFQNLQQSFEPCLVANHTGQYFKDIQGSVENRRGSGRECEVLPNNNYERSIDDIKHIVAVSVVAQRIMKQTAEDAIVVYKRHHVDAVGRQRRQSVVDDKAAAAEQPVERHTAGTDCQIDASHDG